MVRIGRRARIGSSLSARIVALAPNCVEEGGFLYFLCARIWVEIHPAQVALLELWIARTPQSEFYH